LPRWPDEGRDEWRRRLQRLLHRQGGDRLHTSGLLDGSDLGDELGLQGAALVAQAQAPESKTRLRRQTDDAIARGVFGVPSMEVGDELFWGYDDFPYLELCLAGKDPLDSGQWQKWFSAPGPSAVRRRFR